MKGLLVSLRKNRTLLIVLAVLLVLFLLAIQGLGTPAWVITLLRGLSLSAIIFLVAAGFSLIFGLMDVMNFAHGTLFMIGAYVGWSAYVRPDTVLDLLPPVALLAAGLLLQPVWNALLGRIRLPDLAARIWPWVGLLLAAALLVGVLVGWPVSRWVPGNPTTGPGGDSLVLDLALDANLPRRVPASSGRGPVWALVGALAAGAVGAASLAGLSRRQQASDFHHRRIAWHTWLVLGLLLFIAIGAYLANDGLTEWLYGLHTMWMFMIALLFGVVFGALLGGVMEVTLIRPLHDRPIYYLMITLGLGVVGIELVQALWGRTEFTVPRPALFRGSGPGCPATDLASWLQNHCSTILVFGGRVRIYEEIFVILVGLVVLVAVTLLLQRTRLGMIIRAGVQDSEMVEALGINVRRVFTLVFALGVALAVLGGVVAGPRMGLSPAMGESLLLLSLIAMAIGGLTSFPGAAVGSLLVGLLQQFITAYSGVGIKLPFLAEPFKPTPPLVPASTVLLMVIILLVLPQGLLGRKE